MDKKTLIRLATPASIFALAVSIVSFPLISKADWEYNSRSYPFYVKHVNSCN